MQVIVALPEDLSLKREASIELFRKSISVTLSGVAVLCGDLAHDIYGEGSDWVVEEELDGFDGTRFLVIDLRKRESFVDWPAPLAADGVGGGAERTLVIGGKGEAQKRATGRQCAPAPFSARLYPPTDPVPNPPAGSLRTRSCKSFPPTCAPTCTPVRRAACRGSSRRRSVR